MMVLGMDRLAVEFCVCLLDDGNTCEDNGKVADGIVACAKPNATYIAVALTE